MLHEDCSTQIAYNSFHECVASESLLFGQQLLFQVSTLTDNRATYGAPITAKILLKIHILDVEDNSGVMGHFLLGWPDPFWRPLYISIKFMVGNSINFEFIWVLDSRNPPWARNNS